MSKPSKVFSRKRIYEFLWGKNCKVGGRTIDVYISKIRQEIGLGYIKTTKGIGYQLE
ncbi:MAG: winged helix-turn-helix domain-containing protein [Bacteroidales bacterium]|nr:winged helix-turn-helix domain-containing protein [Bacteroidales bacterium]